MKRVYNSTDYRYMKFSVSLVNHLHREVEETRIFSRMIKTGLPCLNWLSAWNKSEQSEIIKECSYFVPWDCCLLPLLPSSPSAPEAFFSFLLYLQSPSSVSPPSVFALLRDTAEPATLPCDPYAVHFRKCNIKRINFQNISAAGKWTSRFRYKMTILNLPDIFQQKLQSAFFSTSEKRDANLISN